MQNRINPVSLLRSLVLLLVFASSAAVSQQMTVPDATATGAASALANAEPLSKEMVRDLVSQLGDDSVRKLLIQRLDAVADARALQNDIGAPQVIGDGFVQYWRNATYVLANISTVPKVIEMVNAPIRESMQQGGYGVLLFRILIALLVGVIAERSVAFLFRKKKQQLIESFSSTLGGILRIIYSRLSMDVLGVLAFGFASTMMMRSWYEPGSYEYGIASFIRMGIFAAWFGYVVCRFFFAPHRPELRICKTSDERAMRLTVSYSLLAGYIVMVHNIYYLFLAIGVDHYGGIKYIAPVGFPLNLSQYLLAIFVIWLNREALSEVLYENRRRITMAIGGEALVDRGWFAIHWPKIAMGLILLKYFMVEVVLASTDIGVYSTAAVYITFIVIFLWPGIDANVSLFVGRGIVAAEDETELASIARRDMQQGLLRVGRVFVVCIVLYALARLWGVDMLGLATSGLGAKAAAKMIEGLFILLFAYITWELVSILVGRWLAAEGGSSVDPALAVGGEGGGESMSRVATVLPLIHRSAKFLIIVMSIIMTLDLLGFNIGPILAGAGVVGLAIGFGAQTLVKDIVSGLFFLTDDAFRVGETINAGGTQGAVEKISLRSLRLRHHEGLVHTIPYGEIPQVTNYSRDWAILKLRFRVPFDTDVNKVKKIFKKIGQEMLEDPVIGPDFLQPFKSQGVAEVDDNGMVVRGKFMAKPGKQFTIRKEVFVRVQKAFEEAGIPFARKQVMVHIPGLEKNTLLKDDDLKTIAAAAADSMDDAAPAAPKGGLQGQ